MVQGKLKIRCTACQSTLKVPLHRRGTSLQCPRCQHPVQIPLSSEPESVDRAQLAQAPREVLHLVPAILRFVAWTVCVGWGSYLVWLHCNPLDMLRGTFPGISLSLAVGVQLLAGYIAARAVESVSR